MGPRRQNKSPQFVFSLHNLPAQVKGRERQSHQCLQRGGDVLRITGSGVMRVGQSQYPSAVPYTCTGSLKARSRRAAMLR